MSHTRDDVEVSLGETSSVRGKMKMYGDRKIIADRRPSYRDDELYTSRDRAGVIGRWMVLGVAGQT